MSFLNDIWDSVSNIIKPLAPLAPMLGTLGGTYLGGPAVGAMGGQLGGILNNIIGGSGSEPPKPQAQPQQQPQFPMQQQQQPGQFPMQQQQPFNPMSFMPQNNPAFANGLNSFFNQYMPQQFQNQQFSNFGPAMGEYLGGQFGHPNFGRAMGQLANPYIQNMMPQNLRNERMGNIGGYLNDNYTHVPNSFGNVPEAPRFDLDMSSSPAPYRRPSGHGGGYVPSSFGNVPRAPRFDLDMGKPNIGHQGSNPQYVPNSFGNVPQAPPFDLNMNAGRPGSTGGFSAPVKPRTYQSRGQEVPVPNSYYKDFPALSPHQQHMNEIRKFRENNTLRPTQTRPSNAYPVSESGGGIGHIMRSNANRLRPMIEEDYEPEAAWS